MRNAATLALGLAVGSVLCLTACTSEETPAPDHPAAASSASRPTPGAEKKLTAQARSALDAVTEQGTSMVESGVERISDGIYTRPDLSAGRTYKLTMVCAGKGAAEIVFAPRKAVARKTVPCDRSVVFERFTGMKALRIDVQRDSRATGMIAWRINTV